jgi:hypothetical protein
VEALLKNIFCFRVCDYTEQQALIVTLSEFIDQNPRVRFKLRSSLSLISLAHLALSLSLSLISLALALSHSPVLT